MMGASPVTGFEVQKLDTVAPGAVWVPVGSVDAGTTELLVSGGLANSTWLFRVRAVNAVGNGDWGQSGPVGVSPTVPGVPTGVVGVPGDSSVAVSWTAPADGESPITASYVRVFVGDEQTPWNTFTVIGADTSRADRQSDQWGGVSLRCAGPQQRG